MRLITRGCSISSVSATPPSGRVAARPSEPSGRARNLAQCVVLGTPHQERHTQCAERGEDPIWTHGPCPKPCTVHSSGRAGTSQTGGARLQRSLSWGYDAPELQAVPQTLHSAWFWARIIKRGTHSEHKVGARCERHAHLNPRAVPETLHSAQFWARRSLVNRWHPTPA